MTPRLILASTSRYRRALMERLGVTFEAVAPVGVDERAVRLPPRELAVALSRAKAESIAALSPNAIVIGSDQVACLDGDELNKPGTPEAACAQLRRLAGREHELITGLCVIDTRTGERHEHLDIHRIRIRELTDAEIADYVRRDAPLDCGGSYKIEGLGISIMDRIDGEDFTAITGLPLIALCRILRHLRGVFEIC